MNQAISEHQDHSTFFDIMTRVRAFDGPPGSACVAEEEEPSPSVPLLHLAPEPPHETPENKAFAASLNSAMELAQLCGLVARYNRVRVTSTQSRQILSISLTPSPQAGGKVSWLTNLVATKHGISSVLWSPPPGTQNQVAWCSWRLSKALEQEGASQ